MKIPSVYLTYYFWREHPSYETGGDIALASVTEVSVSLDTNDRALRVIVTGPMLKKDGTPGRANRGSTVDLVQDQPEWLEAIIADAEPRLRLKT